jgi:hypothetical protein
MLAGALALAGFFVCLRIRIPLAGETLPLPGTALAGPAGVGGGGSA